jgi:hypothetical protein
VIVHGRNPERSRRGGLLGLVLLSPAGHFKDHIQETVPGFDHPIGHLRTPLDRLDADPTKTSFLAGASKTPPPATPTASDQALDKTPPNPVVRRESLRDATWHQLASVAPRYTGLRGTRSPSSTISTIAYSLLVYDRTTGGLHGLIRPSSTFEVRLPNEPTPVAWVDLEDGWLGEGRSETFPRSDQAPSTRPRSRMWKCPGLPPELPAVIGTMPRPRRADRRRARLPRLRQPVGRRVPKNDVGFVRPISQDLIEGQGAEVRVDVASAERVNG